MRNRKAIACIFTLALVITAFLSTTNASQNPQQQQQQQQQTKGDEHGEPQNNDQQQEQNPLKQRQFIVVDLEQDAESEGDFDEDFDDDDDDEYYEDEDFGVVDQQELQGIITSTEEKERIITMKVVPVVDEEFLVSQQTKLNNLIKSAQSYAKLPVLTAAPPEDFFRWNQPITDTEDNVLFLEALAMENAMDSSLASNILDGLIAKGHLSALFPAGKLALLHSTTMHDVQKSLEYLDKAAAIGDPRAQSLRGIIYSSGMHGSPIDHSKAILNHHFSATANTTEGLMSLGFRHLTGDRLDKSCELASAFYEKAAYQVARNLPSVGYVSKIYEKTRFSDKIKSTSSIDKEGIMKLNKWLANSGDSDRMVTIGNNYLYGSNGVSQDFAAALQYYKQAAAKNNAAAYGQIGNVYLHGLGVDKDLAEAFAWFTKGAESSHYISLDGLGYMYLHGLHGAKDYARAFKYFETTAGRGSVEGNLNLGIMYYNGYGVKADHNKAFMHFTFASMTGHTLAVYYLGYMLDKGHGVSANCAIAVQRYKYVAESFIVSELLDHASTFFDRQEYTRALVYSEIAAELGSEIAQSNAGYLYQWRLGYNHSNHVTKALRRYQQSALQGNVQSRLRIGDAYYYGEGVPRNYQLATNHYREASNQKSAQGMFNLAYMHHYGQGVPKDLFIAKRYYDMSAQTSQDAHFPTRIMLLLLAIEYIYTVTIPTYLQHVLETLSF